MKIPDRFDKNGFHIQNNVLIKYFGYGRKVVVPNGIKKLVIWLFATVK